MRRWLATGCLVLLFAGSASAQYLKTRVGRFYTNIAGTGWVRVPGGALGFTPQAAGDVWVILFSARLRSSGTGQTEAEIRFLVNGIEHGIGGTQNSAPEKGASWQQFYVITGTTLRQDIQVQVRDAAGPNGVNVEDLTIVAFKLPAGADYHYAQNETLINPVPGGTFANYLSLNVNPSSGGDYLVLSTASTSELPSNAGIHVRLQDPTAAFWPIDDDPGSPDRFFLNDRGSWWSYFVARKQTLSPGANPYTIQAYCGNATGAQMQYQRILAFRTDAFDAYQGVENTAFTSTTSTTPIVKSTLTTAAPPGSRDYIVIQSLDLSGASTTTDEKRASFRRDGVARTSYGHVLDTANHRVVYSHFDALTTASSALYENTHSTSNAAYTVSAKESVIHVLRLATSDPAGSIGLEAFGAKDFSEGGPGWGDFNGDGCLDLLTGAYDRTIGSTLLMQNKGASCLGTFTDVTDCLGPGLRSFNGERHSLWGDINNDGLPDFVRNTSDAIEIFKNNGFEPSPPAGCPNWKPFGNAGNPTQTLLTADVPSFAVLNSEALAFIDYDRDGVLELVSNMHDEGIVLFENDGTGSATAFSEVILPGLPNTTGLNSGDYGAATDVDADGDVDILQRIENGVDLYLNNNDGTFSAGTFDQPALNSNKGGVAFCDFDADGDFDLFWTDNGTNQVWEQTGIGSATFVARGVPSGINGTIDGVACADFDNDGDVDLALTSSLDDQLFRNDGGFTFADVSPSFFGTNYGHGASFADYDRDGDADLVIQQDGNLFLWKNPTNNNNYLVVHALQDVDGIPGGVTRDAIGATIELLDCEGNRMSGIREIQGGHGHGSQDPAYVHIGLPTSGTPSGASGEYGVRVKFLDGNIVGKAIVPSTLGSYQLLTITSTDADDTSACTTRVELTSFAARSVPSGIELTWTTGSELDNLGFHVYRASRPEGPYEKITDSPLPGLGSSPRGASYRYLDDGLQSGSRYFYELEDIETSGRTKLHGPVDAIAGSTGNDEGGETEAGIRVGTPSSTLRLEARGGFTELELTTEGFEAILEGPEDHGAVRLRVDGLATASGEALPRLRTWVATPDCREAEIVSVRASELERFGLRPAPVEALLEASPQGTVRAGRRRDARGMSAFARTQDAARIVDVGFQRDDKKTLVELSPFRWDEASSELVLARRLVVRISFRGRVRCGAPPSRVSHQRRSAAPVSRLATQKRGLYVLSFDGALRGKRPVEVDRLRLSRLGEAVPFYVEPAGRTSFGPGSHLYFWSEGGVLNPYEDRAVYELSFEGSGLRMTEVGEQETGTPLEVLWASQTEEENRLYQAGLVDAPDLWLWDVLFAPETKTFPFVVDGLAETSDPSLLRVELQGASDLPASPDHHVRVFLNDRFLGEARWDGRRAETLSLEVAPGVLRQGQNRINLENVSDTDASYSMVMLNRFDIDYPHILVARDGSLEGVAERDGTVTVEGLGSTSRVVDITSPEARLVRSSNRFAAEEGHRYFVTDAPLVPELLRTTSPVLGSGSADYLIVGPSSLLPAAEPLLRQRRKQGLRARAVSIESVYDELGYGERRPEALRDFLRYAYESWNAPALRYVVLLGDGTYDFLDELHTGTRNLVPPLVVRTPYLWTASDPGYARVRGEDALPDLAIGRLPASSLEEARAMVAKILSYEDSGALDPAGLVVLVADNPDRAGDFTSDAKALASGLLRDRKPRTLLLGERSATELRTEIARSFDDGASLVSYIGHGGIHVWADEDLFDIEDVATLAPQRQQPIVLSVDCLNGYFHFPYFDSLAESLVKARDKGAIAVVAPSGLSLHREARVLHEILLDEIVHGAHERLGDAWLRAQERYAFSGDSSEDLLTIYHLFGDPALRLR